MCCCMDPCIQVYSHIQCLSPKNVYLACTCHLPNIERTVHLHVDLLLAIFSRCLLADHTPPRRTVADKMSPMRLLASKNKEDALNEINRKMQRALEETLTKNIHLQEVGRLTARYLCTCIYMNNKILIYKFDLFHHVCV